MPSTCSCALHRGANLIRRVSATTLISGGCRPSTIASTIRGDRNPSWINRRIERPSTFSRRAINYLGQSAGDSVSECKRSIWKAADRSTDTSETDCLPDSSSASIIAARSLRSTLYTTTTSINP
jgi:hypothetical protein